MPSKSTRRDWLAGAAVAASAGLAGRAALAQAPEAGARGALTTYQLGPQIWVRSDAMPLTCYRAHPTQKYPYIYPIPGPATGLPVTIESGEDYPHHRSVILACSGVNGADYWQSEYDRGQIVSLGPSVTEGTTSERVVIADGCEWRNPDGEVDFADARAYTVETPTPWLITIEASILLIARRRVAIEKTNHSLFALRAAPDLCPKWGGNLVDSEGRTSEAGTFGQPSNWCAYYATRGDVVEGVALMDHPGNPWSPCTWFTRDYGFISPTPMNWLEAPLEFAEGSETRLRYLIAAFVGTPAEADLDGLFAGWTA